MTDKSQKTKISEFIIDKPIGNKYFKPIRCTLYCSGFQIDISTQNTEKELEHYRSQLNEVKKKLSNENFLNKAPNEIADKERKKKKDFEEKIQILEKQQNI
jgi:valyl-tRNA synthetase